MKTLPTVLGCRAGGGTGVELLPVGLLPWPWCNSKRSSNNSPEVTFLIHLPLNHFVVLHTCTAGRCCLYRAMLRTELPRSLLTESLGQAGWAIQLRQHLGGHQGRHIEVPAGVLPVSTQHLGLLLVREPSQRGAPSRLPPCQPYRGCCNPGCPWEPKPYVHPSGQRKAQGSHLRSGGFTAMVCGKLLTTQPGTLCNMHLSGTRSEGGQLPL